MTDILNVQSKIDKINKIDPEITTLIPGLEDWVLAGRITAHLIQLGTSLVKKNNKLTNVIKAIENEIFKLNCQSQKTIKAAFPVNLSLDACAAHYSPKINDTLTFQNNIVKLDIGVCVDGAIGDSAVTIDLTNTHKKLVQAAEDALHSAIQMIQPGTKLKDIGTCIEKTISKYNYSPIKNLGGHQIERYNLHAGLFIPNCYVDSTDTLKKGQIVAVEPFASTGSGIVENEGDAEIYMLIDTKKMKDKTIKKVLNAIDYFDYLPFSKWELHHFSEKLTNEKIDYAIKELLKQKLLYGFPPLVDTKNGMTSQAEHTIIIANEPIILTTLN